MNNIEILEKRLEKLEKKVSAQEKKIEILKKKVRVLSIAKDSHWSFIASMYRALTMSSSSDEKTIKKVSKGKEKCVA